MGRGDIVETKDFATFVASQQVPEVDWDGVRDEWRDALESLYAKVVEFLGEYVPSSISYQFHEIELTEPDIGDYLVRRMDIKIGRQHVSLVPVGTMLWGCKGRVDVKGSAGEAQILLVNEMARSAADLLRVIVNAKGGGTEPSAQVPPISWSWKILTNTVQKRFEDLDKKSFFNLLMEVANA
jgi:hypothetical protein